MKILITGISGLLGSELYRVFSDDKNSCEVWGLSRHRPSFLSQDKHIEADISDFKNVFSKTTKLNPEVIINTAALSNVDECELKPEEAYKINALGARNIALAARRFDSYLIHISTDYVFGGGMHSTTSPDDEGYGEYDEPNPVNEYGKSKLWGEIMIRESGAAFSIIRTSWIFGSGRTNFITQFADGKNLSAAQDMVSCPTYARDLAYSIKEFIDSTFLKNNADFRRSGIYHLSNAGAASRYEIGIFLAKTLGFPEGKIKRVKTSELHLAARRPNFSALKSTLWQLDGFKPLRPWQDALKEFILNR